MVLKRLSPTRRHDPGGRKQRSIQLWVHLLCTPQVSTQVAGQVLGGCRDEGERRVTPDVGNRAVKALVVASADGNETRPNASKKIYRACLECRRIEVSVQSDQDRVVVPIEHDPARDGAARRASARDGVQALNRPNRNRQLAAFQRARVFGTTPTAWASAACVIPRRKRNAFSSACFISSV